MDSDLFEHTPNLEVLKLANNPFMVLDHGTTIAISSIANLMVSGKNFKWYFNASFTLLQDCYGFLIGYLRHGEYFLKKLQIV